MHIEKDNTARRCRVLGVGLGISYVLIPAMMFNLHLLPAFLTGALHTILTACHLPVGVISLGFLGASLWRPVGRDWPAVDRAFGLFLAIPTVILAFYFFLGWSPSIPVYTETTQRLVLTLSLLAFLLLLSSAGLFFTRYSWASVPLVLLLLLFHVLPIEPDHPDFLRVLGNGPFYKAVDEVFWEAYRTTREPEAVATLFAELPPEARSALSGIMEEDAVQALLERGDDTAFLHAIEPGTGRDEDGVFDLPTRRAVISSTAYIPGTRSLFFVALAYALIRSIMAIRLRNAGPALTEAPPDDQQPRA